MNPLIVFVIALFALNIGFGIGAWWASRHNEDEFKNLLTYPGHQYYCQRCGAKFDPNETEDNELKVCQVCLDQLKANPDDEYLKKWRYE